MTKSKVAIVMLGAPGSGKGTQGELLERETKFKRYVMSDLIRNEIKPGSELHEKIIKKGNLLSDQDIFKIFRKYFKSENKIIIDGLPRTLDQAYWLYGYLTRHKYKLELLFLHVDEKKLIHRITSRYYCPKCHTLYNTTIKEKMPKKEGFCDIDGEKLIQREDDTEKVFNDRIKIFDDVKEVILEVYKGNIITVNGDQDINLVHNQIIKEIKLK